MTKKYFQIKEGDMYVLRYLFEHSNVNFAMSSIYIYLLKRKNLNLPESQLFSVADVVHSTLGDLCEHFSIEYFFDSNLNDGFTKIDHKNSSLKAISRSFSYAIANAPFFELVKFEEGVKYYAVRPNFELSIKYHKKLTKAVAERQAMIKEFCQNKTKYLELSENLSSLRPIVSEHALAETAHSLSQPRKILPKPIIQANNPGSCNIFHSFMHYYSSPIFFSCVSQKRKSEELTKIPNQESKLALSVDVTIKPAHDNSYKRMSIKYILC